MNKIFSIYLWSVVIQWSSLESNFSLMTWWACWLLHGTEIMTNAETVPSWFLLNLKVKHTIVWQFLNHVFVSLLKNIQELCNVLIHRQNINESTKLLCKIGRHCFFSVCTSLKDRGLQHRFNGKKLGFFRIKPKFLVYFIDNFSWFAEKQGQ